MNTAKPSLALALGALGLPGVALAGQVDNLNSGLTSPTIAAAVAAAAPGDTLFVGAGTYVEEVDIDKDLTILGAGRDLVTVESTATTGAIFTVAFGTMATFESLTFAGADVQGIAAIAAASVTIRDVTFLTGTDEAGAGVFALSTPLVVEDSYFDQTSADEGGAIYAFGSDVTCTDCVVTGATATSGGAFYLSGGSLTLIRGSVTDSEALPGDGGAIYLDGSSLTIEGTSFISNSADFGGAIAALAPTALSVHGATFCGNSADDGGAVYATGTGGSFTNSVFVENTGTSGGALLLAGGAWTLESAHVVGNSGGSSGAVNLDTTTATLRNTLFAYNTGVAIGTAFADPTANYNAFFANASGAITGGGTLDAGNVLGLDPLLVAYSQDGDCTNDTLWPSGYSPLIDAGDPALLDPDGSVSDIGAFGGPGADPALFADGDGDGFAFLSDCDDADPDAFAGNDEVCDGRDEDCDTFVDEFALDPTLWFPDADLDGYGDWADPGTAACDAPPGFVADWRDCDDTDDAIHPDADELCGVGTDEDCDGDPERGAVNADPYHPDDDGDGFGDDTVTVMGCTAPSPGWLLDGGDCDDGSAAVNPDALETCDGVDQNCADGELDAPGSQAWYPDADGDGFGDGAAVVDCAQPAGHVGVDGDCDDGDQDTFPGAAEACDDLDNDCSGLADDGDPVLTWYVDLDDDGFGDADVAVSASCQPDGFVLVAGDCNDLLDTFHPGAVEECDGQDEDCSGVADDGAPVSPWYPDLDADGVGAEVQATLAFCAPGPTWVALVTGDCDDADPNAFPGAVEYCDGDDDDCSGTADDGVDIAWYPDTDFDGFGATANLLLAACQPDWFWIAQGGDCDDGDALTHPDALEYCDPEDRDCDGHPTSDAVDVGAWYVDADGDGWGDEGTLAIACDPPVPSAVDLPGDCDDLDAGVNPAQVEVCDGADDNCDGSEGDADDADPWVPDLDGDGHAQAGGAVTWACDAPAQHALSSTADDCDDANAAVFPGATDTCDGLLDEDCSGTVDDPQPPSNWYLDADGDGVGATDSATLAGCPPDDGWVSEPGDCDDADDAVSPAADETCDGADDDCDGLVDDADPDVVDAVTGFLDEDGDGFGGVEHTTCDAAEVVEAGGDCDDDTPTIYPDAEEVPGDLLDQDCDGVDAAAAEESGCNCSTAGSPSLPGPLLALALLLRRRRRVA